MRPKPDHATVAAALRLLGLDRDAAWPDVRARYRELIRGAHPDVTGVVSTSTGPGAAQINQAFAVLRRATDEGRTPLALPDAPSDGTSSVHPRESRSGRLSLGTEHDVFGLLLAGAAELGDVVHADPGSGIIHVSLGGGPARSDLLIEIESLGSSTTASFTLESPDRANAPRLPALVDALARGSGGLLQFDRGGVPGTSGEQ